MTALPEQLPEHLNDRSLLLLIAQDLRYVRADLVTLTADIKEVKATQADQNGRQQDLEARMTNLSGTVQRDMMDLKDAEADIKGLKERLSKAEDTIKTWSIYLKIGIALFTPVYGVGAALAYEAIKRYFFP
jgi:chromosome segregation ATPase